jgi:hypothetical protein
MVVEREGRRRTSGIGSSLEMYIAMGTVRFSASETESMLQSEMLVGRRGGRERADIRGVEQCDCVKWGPFTAGRDGDFPSYYSTKKTHLISDTINTSRLN